MLRFVAAFGVMCLAAAQAYADDAIMRVRMTDEMLAAGFDKHILPRFKFKHRIVLTAVDASDDCEIALVVDGSDGAQVFATADGRAVRLVTVSDASGVAETAGTFRQWLTSTPGKSAVTGFAPDGVAMFTTETVAAVAKTTASVDGDVALGSDLAIRHCGRCHVVDDRNRMGGIGSTPSFAALRGRSNWSDLFLKYWTENPHPSFTHIAGLTEPFTSNRPTHVQPVELTIDDVEAITAFVGTLDALDLGAPIQSQ
jgi:mono/diheme cytochrome c family protein